MAAVAVGADAGNLNLVPLDLLLHLLAIAQSPEADPGIHWRVFWGVMAIGAGAHDVDLVLLICDFRRRGADIFILHVFGAEAMALNAPYLGLVMGDG